MNNKLSVYQQLLEVMCLYEDEFGMTYVTESVLANELRLPIVAVHQYIQEIYENHYGIEKIKSSVYIIHHENISSFI